jgi:hypothetical protein
MTCGIETRAETIITERLLRTTEVRTLRCITGDTLPWDSQRRHPQHICEMQDVIRRASIRRRRDHVYRMDDNWLAKSERLNIPWPPGRAPKLCECESWTSISWKDRYTGWNTRWFYKKMKKRKKKNDAARRLISRLLLPFLLLKILPRYAAFLVWASLDLWRLSRLLVPSNFFIYAFTEAYSWRVIQLLTVCKFQWSRRRQAVSISRATQPRDHIDITPQCAIIRKLLTIAFVECSGTSSGSYFTTLFNAAFQNMCVTCLKIYHTLKGIRGGTRTLFS